MSIWRQIKQSQMKALSTHLKRSYFQIHTPYGMNNTSLWCKITACNLPSLPYQRSQFDITKTNLRFYAAPSQAMQKKDDKSDGVRLNEEITADVVRVVSEEGHTVMPKQRALFLAKSRKLDLVEVQRNATPPVCKIMDYNRETYQKTLKEKERVKEKGGSKLKTGECKEVRFAGKITQKDLQIKADMVKRLMEKGHRVKCLSVGRTIKQTGAAEDSKTLLSRFLSLIEDVSVIESDSRITAKKDQAPADEDDQTQAVEKDQAHIIVRHIKYGPLKKGLGKNTGKNDKAPSTNAQQETSENDAQSDEILFGKENLCESNPISSTLSSPVPELEYANRQKTPSSVSSGVTENRYLKNSRDRARPNNYSTDGRTSLRNSPFPTQSQFNVNPSFQQRKPEYTDNGSPQIQNPRVFSPRQGDNTVREQRQETVVNRYKVRNPSESARDPRPNSPFPSPRINREQAVDENHQGRWGVFNREGSNSRVPDRRIEGQGTKVPYP